MLSHGAERDALRGQLVKAHEQVRALEAKLAGARHPRPRTRLLVLDAFLESAELALRACERESAPFCAAVIDIDGFRELNARRGRLAGDAALIGIAARLRRLTRAGDVLGRSGADEITVVMPSTKHRRRAHMLRPPDPRARGGRPPRRRPRLGVGRHLDAHPRPGARRRARRGAGRRRPRTCARRRAQRGADRRRHEGDDEPGAGRGRRRARGHAARARPLHRRALRVGRRARAQRRHAARHGRAGDRDRLRRRAPARHRQGRDPGPRPQQARPARRLRVAADARAPGDRRAHPARDPRHGRRSRGSCATSTSTGTAPATRTTCSATRSRSAAASSSPATPTAR